jgi:ribosome maturation factor RimP
LIQESQIRKLAEESLQDAESFLVDVSVRPGNRILVHIDSLKGLTVHDCVKVSRHIEGNLDREKEDFELEVSSPGADRPFKVFEQYRKYTGKKVEVTLEDGKKITGVLEAADPEKIQVKPDPEKKGKKQELESLTFNISEIKQTRAIISFK